MKTENPRSHEAIVQQVETTVLQSESDRGALGLLWATGCPDLYPLTQHRATNYATEIKKYQGTITKDVLQSLIRSGRENAKVLRLLRLSIGSYLTAELIGHDTSVNNDRASIDGFWQREIATLPEGADIISRVSQDPEKDPWQQYMGIRNTVINENTSADKRAELLPIFDAVERAAGKQDAERLFQTVGLIKDLGFAKINDFLELMLGEEAEVFGQRIDSILHMFQSTTAPSLEPVPYFDLMKQTTAGIVNTTDPNEVISLAEASLASFGIDPKEWRDQVIVSDQANPSVQTAFYYLIAQRPALQIIQPNTPVWDEIQAGKHMGIVMRAGIKDLDSQRLLFHEVGHTVEGMVGIPPQLLLGRPITLSEIFSLLNEAQMPNLDYFKAKEAFLTRRFAALSKHEMFLWQEAERVVDKQDETARAALKKDFMAKAEVSYQQTLGDTLDCVVPKGRALRDFFNSSNPMVPASYTISMPLALATLEKVQAHTQPTEKRALLQAVATQVASTGTVEAVLESLGMNWEEALAAMGRKFSH